MIPRHSRREFIQSGLLAAGAGQIVSPGRSLAIEPIERPGAAHFKFSLAAYSYRKLLTGSPAELTLHDFVDDCAAMGLDGTELTSYYFPPSPTPEYLRDLKQHCFRLGLDVSGTAVGNDFCHPPGERRTQEIADVKRWIDYAEILGAPVIRIFSGSQRDGQTPAEAHRLAVAGIEECCDYAGQHGVFLALENHGGLTTKVDGILALVKDVQSRWFGVNLDTGNFRDTSDVYGDLAKLAPYTLNVQVKVVVHPKGGDREPADFQRLAKILSEAGYRGYVVLEYEEAEDPRVACPKYVDKLRTAFG